MTHSSDAHAPITPGFIVLQGNRLEGLRDLLVQWLERAPLAPLEDERILVQSNGMAQWLRLALGRSRRDSDHGGGLGVATAMDLLLPARLQWQCYRAVLGREAVPPEAPLDKPRPRRRRTTNRQRTRHWMRSPTGKSRWKDSTGKPRKSNP